MSALEFMVIVALVIGVPALLLGLLRAGNPALASGEWPGHWHFSIKGWHLFAAALAFLLFLASMRGPDGAIFFFLMALLIVGYYLYWWQKEFLFLMSLKDDQLPGRHDKLIWAFVLIALAPIGLWVFRSYHLAMWPKAEPQAKAFSGNPAPDLY